VANHITGIVFSDGEIFSNLQLTQAVYDALAPDQRKMPLAQSAVLNAMQEVVPTLLREDGVVFQLIAEKRLDALLQEVTQITSNEQKLVAVLTQANAEANRYAQAYGVGAKEAKGKK
jgi:CRISPR-associated protein Csc2